MNSSNSTNPLEIALFEPRIPQNTGNIARTCSAFNLPLHLIKPLGFSLEDKYLKRAGLDYWPYMDIKLHSNFSEFSRLKINSNRIIGFSKSSTQLLDSVEFKLGDILLFGREDTGLPDYVRDSCNIISSIPMPGGVTGSSGDGVRSLNLSSALSIVAYQASLKLGIL